MSRRRGASASSIRRARCRRSARRSNNSRIAQQMQNSSTARPARAARPHAGLAPFPQGRFLPSENWCRCPACRSSRSSTRGGITGLDQKIPLRAKRLQGSAQLPQEILESLKQGVPSQTKSRSELFQKSLRVSRFEIQSFFLSPFFFLARFRLRAGAPREPALKRPRVSRRWKRRSGSDFRALLKETPAPSRPRLASQVAFTMPL